MPEAATTVVARETARRAVRGAVLWGYVFGLFVAESAFGFASLYKTAAERAALARTFASNPGLSALIGPAHDLRTVAGFTAWRSLLILNIVGAVWGLLAGTRLLRGEEEAGRWELLVSGQTTRRRATAQALAGLGTAWVVLWVITALLTVVIGRSSRVGIPAGSALFFSLAAAAGAAVFLTLGVLASQLAPTRRQAAAYTGTALGLAYALRMVADSGTGLQYLRWATPLGWVEELRPLTGSRPLVLLPLAGLVAVSGAVAVYVAGRRDLGSGLLPEARAPSEQARLSGPTSLALRLVRPMTLTWGVAIVALALMLGLIAKSAGSAMGGASFHHLLGRLGARGAGTDEYLGIGFLMLSVLLSFVAAAHLTASRGEEADGRLDHLLVRPVSRWSWLGGRLLVATGALALGGLAAGLFTWLGTASQSAGLRLASSLAAGIAAVPAALVVAGAGALALGFWPRGVSAVTYGLIAWSFLLELLAGLTPINHFLLDLSLFHHLNGAPAVSPDWSSAAVLAAVALAAAVVGATAFARRDLAGP